MPPPAGPPPGRPAGRAAARAARHLARVPGRRRTGDGRLHLDRRDHRTPRRRRADSGVPGRVRAGRAWHGWSPAAPAASARRSCWWPWPWRSSPARSPCRRPGRECCSRRRERERSRSRVSCRRCRTARARRARRSGLDRGVAEDGEPLFSLGRYGVPITVAAVLYQIGMIVNLLRPRAAVYDLTGNARAERGHELTRPGGTKSRHARAPRGLTRGPLPTRIRLYAAAATPADTGSRAEPRISRTSETTCTVSAASTSAGTSSRSGSLRCGR